LYKSIVNIIINTVVVFIIAYVYMYFSGNLHVSEEPLFKLIAITFTFSNAIIIGLKLFFEKNNNIDIDMD
jgi:hypothetical protein